MGRKRSELTPSMREKNRVHNRMKEYGDKLENVTRSLTLEDGAEMLLSQMRIVQKALSVILGLSTDRSAWRTKLGCKLWFSEHWNEVKSQRPFYELLKNPPPVMRYRRRQSIFSTRYFKRALCEDSDQFYNPSIVQVYEEVECPEEDFYFFK
ncbi:hypothetical protein TRFO_35891 [Tritrichomonas foetus]|uniref:Uncharacterized protein n=1 Tax=Tritrichomonas foetus TaxID=1144522 RepID=A0A1J4JJZ9_9EUKA|nr:hypothetical protein TRFO_35891 [Tritrichomonas foetus]|eukprot:OHS97851.1 hypothetical protein TRFO_35891 [Tritrichomonas foetus]